MKKKTEHKFVMIDTLKSGSACRIEHCTVRDSGSIIHYSIFLPTAVCDWFHCHIYNGLVLGVVLAILLRMKWEEICALTYDKIINGYKGGVYIPIVCNIDGEEYLSGRMVNGSRLLQELVIERIIYLHDRYGYSVGDIFQMPIVCGNNPRKPATVENLQSFAQRWIQEFDGQLAVSALGISKEKGAIK